MLDSIPAFARRPLWRLKHVLFKYASDRGLIEYYHGALENQLKRCSTDLVLDVGANTGQYVRTIRRLGYHGDIHSFEPIPTLAQRLSTAAATSTNWTVHPIGLGAQTTEGEINVMADSSFSSLRNPNAFALETYSQATSITAKLKVPVRRLDDVLIEFIPEYAKRSIHLKIDTQGTDMDVILGAGQALTSVKSMQIEIGMQLLYEGQSTYGADLERLDRAGYDLAGIYPVSRDRTGRVVDADCLFTRR
jgi:FkbM family methyltransferase